MLKSVCMRRAVGKEDIMYSFYIPCLSAGVIVDIIPRITGIIENENTQITATEKKKVNKVKYNLAMD